MGSVLEVSILHHVGFVFVVLWLLNSYNCCGSVVYLISFVYLFLVHDRYVVRLRKKVEFEEKRNSNQRRVLSDSETVRWLNYAVEKMWTVCMEEIVSQKILLPIVPWFLQKYKPWTVKEVEVQQLYLGRSPPMFTEMRVLHQSNDDDHLVFELGMNFLTADDMSALMAVKLRKRLGFGMWAKLHLLGMHIEGKVLIGVKFVRRWPFIGRVRLCFVEPPYFQMTVKPIFTHGLDVTELPGIAGWLDKLLSLVFEQTLVQPNMLVVDVEKLVSPKPENWFTIDEKQPVAYVLVEVIEAADMKPSDLNGLADPYVKGQLGPYRFRTKIQKKTLTPKWHEEFKVPICTWESPNILAIEVRDKDHFVDDKLGECSVDINDFRDDQRHDIWLSLQNVKVGRLHIAISIIEGNEKACDEEDLNQYKRESFATDMSNKDSFSSATSDKSSRVGDKFEPIVVEGQQETGIWVHRPGNEVAQVWEPRKGKSRRLDTEILSAGVESGSFKSRASGPLKSGGINGDESLDAEKEHSPNRVQRGFHKIGSIFHRRSRIEEKNNYPEVPVSSPHVNLRSVDSKREIGVRFVVDDATSAAAATAALNTPKTDEKESSEGSGPDSPHKVKDVAKNILRQAGKSARDLKHAISRKGSRKFKSDSGELPTERNASGSSSSSSGEESALGTIGVEAIQVPSEPISGCSIVSPHSSEPKILSSGDNDATNPEEPVYRSPEASKVEDNNNTSSLIEKTGPVPSSSELPVTHPAAMEEGMEVHI